MLLLLKCKYFYLCLQQLKNILSLSLLATAPDVPAGKRMKRII